MNAIYYGNRVVIWELPVGPNGNTPTVRVDYTPEKPWDPGKRVDVFSAGLYIPTSGNVVGDEKVIVRPPGWGSQTQAAASLSQPQDDDYYLWQTYLHLLPTQAVTMSASLCQNQVNLLQSGDAFFALRFPVNPTLPYTVPYTLPVVTSPITYTPRLVLKETVPPFSTFITLPLEYKLHYLGFLENRLPEAPGEHWLALGAVMTPTVSCSSVPTTTKWAYEAEFWLDLSGTPGAGLGQTLPSYYCYRGQTLPTYAQSVLGANAESYQDWGITCIGPQPVSLTSAPWVEFAYTHMQSVTPTQTITLYHHLRTWTGVTQTVTITHSSAPDLPWRLYTAYEANPSELVPITGPLEIPSLFFRVCPLWASVTVPEDAPAGAATLVITATSVTSPTRSVWTSDQLWIGEWVAPPPPPWEKYKVYLPLMPRGAP